MAVIVPNTIVLATTDTLGATAVLTADTAWPRLNRRARLI